MRSVLLVSALAFCAGCCFDGRSLAPDGAGIAGGHTWGQALGVGWSPAGDRLTNDGGDSTALFAFAWWDFGGRELREDLRELAEVVRLNSGRCGPSLEVRVELEDDKPDTITLPPTPTPEHPTGAPDPLTATPDPTLESRVTGAVNDLGATVSADSMSEATFWRLMFLILVGGGLLILGLWWWRRRARSEPSE